MTACRAGVQRYFFSSSACACDVLPQQDPKVRALKESDAYPAMAERGYGWENLMSEIFCQEYWAERGLKPSLRVFTMCTALTGLGMVDVKRRQLRFAERYLRQLIRAVAKFKFGATVRLTT